MRTRTTLEPLLSAGVAPSTALSYQATIQWAMAAYRHVGRPNGDSKGCEKGPTRSDLCRPWREEAGDREANDPPRSYHRAQQRLRVLPTEPVGQRDAPGLREQPYPLVVADRRGVDVRLASHLPDGQRGQKSSFRLTSSTL